MPRLAILGLLSVAALRAATLYSQSPGPGTNGYANSAPKNLFPGPSYRAFDTFSLLPGATVNEIVWWGLYDAPTPNFEIAIYNGSDLSSPIWIQTPANVQKEASPYLPSFGVSRYSAFFANPFVAPNSGSFTISIYHRTSFGIGWYWLVADTPGDGALSAPYDLNTGGWADTQPIARNLAFELNEVPEPGYQALIALSLLACAWLHHHRPHLHRALAPRMKALPRRNRLV